MKVVTLVAIGVALAGCGNPEISEERGTDDPAENSPEEQQVIQDAMELGTLTLNHALGSVLTGTGACATVPMTVEPHTTEIHGTCSIDGGLVTFDHLILETTAGGSSFAEVFSASGSATVSLGSASIDIQFSFMGYDVSIQVNVQVENGTVSGDFSLTVTETVTEENQEDAAENNGDADTGDGDSGDGDSGDGDSGDGDSGDGDSGGE